MRDRETRFKLTLHYDGSPFHGWQVQPGKPTVQGELERVVRRLTGERRPVMGAGRTDAGVHATGQVAAVTLPPPWTASDLARSLNALLPGAIWVQGAQAVPRDFNPRFEATARTYEYRIGTAPVAASPFWRRGCWPLCRALDPEAMKGATRLLRGQHSFRAFAKTGQPERGCDCRVSRAQWRRWEDLGVIFEISANRFLHRTVRYLVGTLVDIGMGRRNQEDMARLLQKDPALVTSPPAPARGLFLVRVAYPGRAGHKGIRENPVGVGMDLGSSDGSDGKERGEP